jgi:hypothetical protein
MMYVLYVHNNVLGTHIVEPKNLSKGHVRTPKNHSNGLICSMPAVLKSLCCNKAIAAYVREGYGQV